MNRTDPPSRAQAPLMVSGTFTRTVNGVEVVSGYAYMAQRSTIFDHELVAWANRREAEIRAKRSAPQAAGTARPGGVREPPPPRSAAAAGKGA